jgi:hypothetical protein
MRYRGRKLPLSEISRELKVDAVVEGTAARFGERVRISVHLIDARDDRHLWAENYDRDLRDIVALQSEMARAIANQIRIQMTPGERTRFALVRQVDPGAYEAYARGRHFWNKRTADGFHKATAYFNEAIGRDPGYALAHAGLADTYNLAAMTACCHPERRCRERKTRRSGPWTWTRGLPRRIPRWRRSMRTMTGIGPLRRGSSGARSS